MGKLIKGKLSDILRNFDYMAHWGVLKTREEVIGKPILFDINEAGERVPLGKIIDCDPDNDAWIGELYL